MTNVITLEKVSKSFGQNHVLKNISLQIKNGQLIGLIGPSGTGKTTMIAAILGMIKLDSGKITVLDKSMPNREVLGKIGYMAQSDALYTSPSGRENLRFFAGLMKQPGEILRDQIKRVSEIVDLQDSLDIRVSNYSGGMKRRLSLAIALLANSPIILLDEPTVGIDPELRVQVWAELRKLHKSGKTIIVTTHVMDEVEHVDRVLMLRNGQIIADDLPQKLESDYKVNSIEKVFIKAGEKNAHSSDL
ncbi:ABC transporter ATP-binding protein [Oenococcus oeni]|uniref:ABC transporter ATP-binding protein n=1 Tax=Oenococcus oeni TaxID=1247 RepID=UPI000BDEB6E0|nr:ABC transporter ATP-binding protein [Oenococcus oeni]PDH94222.1 glycosyl transferase family 2 [Oenococcus oeni]